MIYLAIVVGMGIMKVVPRRLVFLFSESLAILAFYLFHGFRRRSVKNLSLALGNQLDERERAKVVRRSLKNFFHDFAEMGYSMSSTPQEIRQEIGVVGSEHLVTAMAHGKGVIALGAHLGNFFLVGTRVASEGYSTYILVNPPRNESLRELFVRYRLKNGKKTIHSRPRHQAFRELAQALRRNEVVVVIADEYRSTDGIDVPFFGRMVLARRGPATLALRTGAAVVPMYMIRDTNGRLTLVIEPEMELLRTGEIKTDVRENTLRITQWVERTVRSYPDQWNWMNIRWQENRPGS